MQPSINILFENNNMIYKLCSWRVLKNKKGKKIKNKFKHLQRKTMVLPNNALEINSVILLLLKLLSPTLSSQLLSMIKSKILMKKMKKNLNQSKK